MSETVLTKAERAVLDAVPDYWQAPLTAREVHMRMMEWSYTTVLKVLKKFARMGIVERRVAELAVSDRGFMADHAASTYRRMKPRVLVVFSGG